MDVQIVNYGACIRIVSDSTVSMIAKSQIRCIEAVRDDTLRIDLGEGPLKDILIKLSDVSQPAGIMDIAALRDLVTHMLDLDGYEQQSLLQQQAQIAELVNIKQMFTLMNTAWQGLLNYQQLQINTLVGIDSLLTNNKNYSQQIVTNQEEQTVALKTEVGTLNNIFQAISNLTSHIDNVILAEKDQTTMVTSIKYVLDQMQLNQTDNTRVLSDQWPKLNEIAQTLDTANSLFYNMQANEQVQSDHLREQIVILNNILASSQQSSTAAVANMQTVIQSLSSLVTDVSQTKALVVSISNEVHGIALRQ